MTSTKCENCGKFMGKCDVFSKIYVHKNEKDFPLIRTYQAQMYSCDGCCINQYVELKN